jgi:hypothetical protein
VGDYGDPEARVGLVDALARDGLTVLLVMEGGLHRPRRGRRPISWRPCQDLDHDDAGMFRIARRVAKDRVISTVHPQTRHGRKTAADRFDATNAMSVSTPIQRSSPAPRSVRGNAGDASVAEDLIANPLHEPVTSAEPVTSPEHACGRPRRRRQ